MPYRMNYPATVREVLDEQMKFKPAALRQMRQFVRARPYRGSSEHRQRLFTLLSNFLADAYGIARPALTFEPSDAHSGASCYLPAQHRIILRGRLSVVTFLHEFAHARGFDERQACRWSLNLFRRFFPRSFNRCRQVAHTLVAPTPRPERNA